MPTSSIAICPGRGSYTKKELGQLNRWYRLASAAETIEIGEKVREARKLKSLLDLDGRKKFGSFHLHAENASPMIALLTLLEWEHLNREKLDIVGITGNSMGWYTTLILAGCLDAEQGLSLVQDVSKKQASYCSGGQIVYPIIDQDWRIKEELIEEIDTALESTRAESPKRWVGWSINLGGFAILAGTDKGLERLKGKLTEVNVGRTKYPLSLRGQYAFHTKLMAEYSEALKSAFNDLTLAQPKIPLVDGSGRIWERWMGETENLKEYTFGEQVLTTFDLTGAITVAAREFAPSRFCLLGPGSSLYAPIAHSLIHARWMGLSTREEFENYQQDKQPLVYSMGRYDEIVRPLFRELPPS